MSKKIITGVKPTGSSMHLGNLMGAVLPFANVATGNDAAIFIADLHAITSVKNGKTLREQTLEVAIEYLSIFGIDTPITIFRQSDIADITRLMWILTNVTSYSLMLRAHSYKDFQQKVDFIKNEISSITGKISFINDELVNLTTEPIFGLDNKIADLIKKSETFLDTKIELEAKFYSDLNM